MRAWIIADTHFGIKNDDHTWLETFSYYFDHTVIPLLEREVQQGDILIHLGDVFDNRKFVGLNTLSYTISLFEKFSKLFPSGIKIICGNHDIFNKGSNDVTSVDMLKHIQGVEVYKEPKCELLGSKQCLFMPWQPDSDAESSVLRKYNSNHYVFCHAEIHGANLGSGMKSECNLKTNSFGKSQVYAGHIHIRSNYPKNIHYVGTPYQMTRTDIDQPKGIVCLDIETGEERYYENTVSPKFIKFMVKPDAAHHVDLEPYKALFTNNHVDVCINATEVPKLDVNAIMSEVSETAKSVTLKIQDDIKLDDVTVNEDLSQQGDDAEMHQSKSISCHIDDYIDMVKSNVEIEDTTLKCLESYVQKLKKEFNE